MAEDAPPTARLLAPRPPTMLPLLASGGSGSSGNNSGSRSKKKVTSACLECRRARSKCSSSRPCARCSSLGVQCVFDEGGDLRRREARERRANEVAQQQQMLEDVLQFVRLRSDARVLDLVSVIRQTHSNSEIHSWIRQQLYDDPYYNPDPARSTNYSAETPDSLEYTQSPEAADPPGPRRHAVFSVHELADQSRSRGM